MAKKPKSKNKKKMSQGGKLVGPSHANGGIQGVVDGTEPIEVEGGEFIINKESAAALGDDFLHKLNATGTNMNGPGGFQPGQLGNGSSYQYGGSVNRGSGNTQMTNQSSQSGRTYGRVLKGVIRGVTSEAEGHVHQYLILPSGVVHILPAYHPNSKQIYHSHEYVDGVFPSGQITENQSDCHPNCKNRHGYDGVGMHNHHINIVDDTSVRTIKNRRTKKHISNRYTSSSKTTRVKNQRRANQLNIRGRRRG